MNTSEQINEIAAALAKAQGAIQDAAKGGQNRHLGTKYATLTSIWDACRKELSGNSIAVVQAPSTGDDGSVVLTTRVIHSSGQWLESSMACRPAKFDAQSIGSVTTYLKKYMLAAMVGVAPDDDDDGESAMGRGGNEFTPSARQSPSKPRQTPKASSPFDDTSAAKIVRYGRSDGKSEQIPIDTAIGKLKAAANAKEHISAQAFKKLMIENDWCRDLAPVEWANIMGIRGMTPDGEIKMEGSTE